MISQLDAVLLAIPEGWMWQVGHDGEGPDPALFRARIVTAAPECHSVSAVGDTPAEALAQAVEWAHYAVAVL